MILTVAMIQTVIAIAHQFSKMAPKKAAYSENQDTVLWIPPTKNYVESF